MLKILPNTLFELERELAEPPFMGVPVGSTLANVFHIDLYLGNGQWDIKSVWKDRVRFWYHYLGLPFHRSGTPPNELDSPLAHNLILLTMLHKQTRFIDLMLPLAQYFGSSICNVLAYNTQISDFLPNGMGVFPITSLHTFFDRSKWQHEFRRCFPAWKDNLKKFLDKHSIPRNVMPHLLDTILVNSYYIAAYHGVLDLLAPTTVVTEFDRGPLAASLILAAKARGISTVTLMHGAINPPYGYVPLLADLALCWGQQSYDQMVQMGTEPERLLITGNHTITPNLSAHRSTVRHKFGLMDERPLVLLASNPINTEHRKQWVRGFCEAFSGQREIFAAVRLHPSETLEFYNKEIREFPAIRFTRSALLSAEEALAAADVIVSRSSGFGNEALVKGKPLVIFDAIDAPLGNANGLIEQAGCPYAQMSDTLHNIVRQIAFDSDFRTELKNKAQSYVKYQFAAFGTEALENIVTTLQAYHMRNNKRSREDTEVTPSDWTRS